MKDEVKDFEFYKSFYENVATHVEVLVTEEMRRDAYTSTEHDLSFQVYRLLVGYEETLAQRQMVCDKLERVYKTVKAAQTEFGNGKPMSKRICSDEQWIDKIVEECE